MFLVHKNYWRTATPGTPSSQHPQFPLTDSKIDNLKQMWRTRYGTGSGNGTFVVAAANKNIDFDEGAAELTAVLTEGTYNGLTLAAEMKIQLDASGALTYTVAYDEATALFTIAATGNFSIHWNTGAHKTTDVSALCGFSDAADDTGAATYTADLRRIHYPSENTGWFDAGAAVKFDFLALLGHTLSSATVITFTGADDTSGTNPESETITWAAGDIFHSFGTAITKRYFKVTVADPANAAAYAQITTGFAGEKWTPSRGYTVGFQDGPLDASTIQLSDSLVAHGQNKPRVPSWTLPFKGLNDADKVLVKDLLTVCGIVYGFIVCLDPTTPATNTYFVMNASITRPQADGYQYWNWALDLRKVQ